MTAQSSKLTTQSPQPAAKTPRSTAKASKAPKAATSPASASLQQPPTLKFLHLYPDMMDLYGDSGNLQILKYRAEQRGIPVQIDRHTISNPAGAASATSTTSATGTTPNLAASAATPSSTPGAVPTTAAASATSASSPDFASYDLIFIGGGSDREQKVVAKDILKYRAGLAKAYQAGVFFLAICGGFQLFGRYYKDAEGNTIKGLRFFDFYTVSSLDKRQRCIGNIVLFTELPLDPSAGPSLGPTSDSSLNPSPNASKGHSSSAATTPVYLVGFENHGGQTYGIDHPFGDVIFGNGNTFQNRHEGLMTPNFIGTYLHGTLLSKNPELSDYILKRCLSRRSSAPVQLSELDDSFERQAKKEMLERLLSGHAHQT